MKEQYEIKVGDLVELISSSEHNSDALDFKIDTGFEYNEIGSRFNILDIQLDRQGRRAYQVRCKLGITYLRRKAFRLVKTVQEESITEDLSYLIPFLEKYNK